MKKRLLALSAFVSLVSGTVFSQQEKLLTHFIYDKMSLNPGSTGSEEGICGTMIYRNQWDKVNGAPNSALLNVEAKMDRFFPGGLGVSFYHDAIGFSRQNNLLLNYSYPLPLNLLAGTLRVGVGAGMINFGMDPTWIPPTTMPDNSLPASNSSTNVDFNAGLYWKGRQDYYAGISSTHLSRAELKNINYTAARHYFIMGGKKFPNLFGPAQGLDAQVLMRTDMVKFSADLNVRYMHQNLFYGGLTYRTSDAVAVMLGFMPIQNMTVGYSYDLTINQLSNISRGTHELLVRYCYFIPPPPVQKSKHPRWL